MLRCRPRILLQPENLLQDHYNEIANLDYWLLNDCNMCARYPKHANIPLNVTCKCHFHTCTCTCVMCK